ncbi:phospholipid scramblase 1-like [Physella acuta]|uniref:phospholipid scramblase 1-like n=1 Tax=Physella acuta TaxID=109671 RepID=UPI0027DD250E|nr:phospholipid scramblase 1-like [Physella acuta]XP_059175517.1 phospholipid scramblase 1-like [Physella acuta]
MGKKKKNAVTQQPGKEIVMMPRPEPIPGCPPGLEYLTAVDQLICKQEVNFLEALLGFEAANKYKIFNTLEQQVYTCLEESDACNRNCWGPQRGFVFHIVDNNNQEVMLVDRPFRACSGCCCCADGCCLYPIFVRDRTGNHLGMIRMMNSKCKPHFGIFDANGDLLYEIWGPACTCSCGGEIPFPIRSVRDGSQVGGVTKVWAGALREFLSDADTYSVTFPMNLDVKHKALIFACFILIDFSLFETDKNDN